MERKSRGLWADLAQRFFFLLAVRPFLVLFIGLKVKGREHLPAREPFVLIANHSSHLDTVSLLSLFPPSRLRRIRPVAAADYFERNRVVSFLTRTLFNILPIARQGITRENDPRQAMLEALDRGDSLILFPEGTRGSGEEPGPFRGGVAHLIEKRPDVPVVPAYLVNMGRSLPKGTSIPVPFFCEIHVGPRCRFAGTQAEILESLRAAVFELKRPAPDSSPS